MKPFNTPANSPAVSQQTKPKILSPAVCLLELEPTPVYSRGFVQGHTAKAKAIQPYQLYPLNIHLPHFTRLNPVKNAELQVPNRLSL